MRFTSDDFRKCLFYAASGTDLQPLLRYSHLTQTILYVTVGDEITPEVVLGSIKAKLGMLGTKYPGALKLQGVPRAMKARDFDYQWPADCRRYLREEDLSDYQKAFSGFQQRENWALDLQLLRRIGPLSRPLRVVFLSGEALATYAALSHGGKFAPAVFCSIQTGVLEVAEGMMARVFETSEARPAIWIRGLWHDPRVHAAGTTPQLRRVLCERGPYPVRVQSYQNWNARMGTSTLGRGWGSENPLCEHSCVAAFAQRPLNLEGSVTFGTEARRVRVFNRPFRLAEASSYERILVPNPLLARRPAEFGGDRARGIDLRARNWAPEEGRMGPVATLPEILNQIDGYAASQPGIPQALIGSGFEDEGLCLREWSVAEGPACHLDVFAPEPLDYADLRGWPLN